jgi:dihydropyrimidinase
MYRLVLTGGEVVTPAGPQNVDIGIVHDRIAALRPPGGFDDQAERSIDVSGCIVVPGGIDPHVHAGVPPGAPATVVSRAALHGGTTTIIDFSRNEAGESLAQTIERTQRAWSGNWLCDFSFHLRLGGPLRHDLLAEIPETIATGLPSFKVFMTDGRPHSPSGKTPFGSIQDLIEVTAGRGIVAVHAEDDDLVMHGYERYTAPGGDLSFRSLPRIHTALSEEISTSRIIRLAQDIEDSALYIMHVGSAGALASISRARSRGQAVYAETLHVFALRNESDYLEPDGVKYHNFPSLKTAADNTVIWEGLADGTISTLATDSHIVSYADKTAGTTILSVIGGHCGIEPRMAIAYTELVTKRRLGVGKFVDITSTNVAKILGLYPRKGVIAVGSDADLTVFDPLGGRAITVSDLHESDWTPWEGWKVTAWPVLTVLRGQVVVERGEFTLQPVHGQFIPRKLDCSVFEGSAA